MKNIGIALGGGGAKGFFPDSLSEGTIFLGFNALAGIVGCCLYALQRMPKNSGSAIENPDPRKRKD